MQILLQALIAETSEGKKPAIANLLNAEGDEQALFAEVFKLADGSIEEHLETAVDLVELADQSVEIAPLQALAVKDGDILLPDVPRPAPKPEPTIIEAAPLAPDDIAEPETIGKVEAGEEQPTNDSRKAVLPPEESSFKGNQAPSLAENEFSTPSARVIPEGEGRLNETVTPRPNGEQPTPKTTVAQANVATLQPPIPNQEIDPGHSTTKLVDPQTERPVRVDAPETLMPRDTPASARPQQLELQVQTTSQRTHRSEHTKADLLETKNSQATQTAAPTLAAIAQSTAAAAPVIQTVLQSEKASSRDTTLSPEGISFAAASEGSELRSTSAGTVRPEPTVRPVVNQVVQMVFRAAVDGMVEVRLQPEELGRLRIAMTQVENGVVVQVSAERPETLDLLRRNIDMLERDLREQGFGNASFSFGDGSNSAPNDDSDVPNFTETSKPNVRIEADVRPERMAVNDGRLDIRL